jgi:hypothetical protein
MIPESFIVSMLPPEEFGTYLAVGTQKRSRGRAMFFDLKPDFRDAFFSIDAAALCGRRPTAGCAGPCPPR